VGTKDNLKALYSKSALLFSYSDRSQRFHITIHGYGQSDALIAAILSTFYEGSRQICKEAASLYSNRSRFAYALVLVSGKKVTADLNSHSGRIVIRTITITPLLRSTTQYNSLLLQSTIQLNPQQLRWHASTSSASPPQPSPPPPLPHPSSPAPHPPAGSAASTSTPSP